MYMSVSESKAQPGRPWAHVSWPRGPQAKQHFRLSPTLVSLTSELNSLALRARAPEPLSPWAGAISCRAPTWLTPAFSLSARSAALSKNL